MASVSRHQEPKTHWDRKPFPKLFPIEGGCQALHSWTGASAAAAAAMASAGLA